MNIEDIYSNFPILETERLLLRKVTLHDIDEIFYYGSNDEVTKYLIWDTHNTLEDTKSFIEFALKRYDTNQLAPWELNTKILEN